LLLKSLYGIAVAVYVYPLLDLMYTVIPVRPDVLQWRFGTVGFGAQTLWSQLLGLGLAAWVAWTAEHKIVLKVLAIYCFVLVVVLTVIAGGAALDYLQLRRSIVQGLKTKADFAAFRMFAQLGIAWLVALPLGIGAWRASRLFAGVSRSGNDRLGVVFGVGAKQSSRGAT
jgi:hypothetical protein